MNFDKTTPNHDHFNSFGTSLNIAIIGASGGLGRALLSVVEKSPVVDKIFAFSRSKKPYPSDKISWHKLDLENESSISKAAITIKRDVGGVHIVFLASGILHHETTILPEKSWRTINGTSMERVFWLNTIGPALVAKYFLPLLIPERKTVFAALSARVGSITENNLGGWHSYRSSKAALNMLIKTFSIELARKNPKAICASLHPGTVDTPLSKPFQASISRDKLFTPARAACQLINVIESLTPEDSGGLFSWNGKQIPF